MAALLALAASLSWGVGDFLGGVKARVLPSLTVLAVSQPFGLAALGVAVAVRGAGIPGDEVAWAALAAVFGTVGLFAFYRGMAAGAMSVVTPIAALAAGIPVIWGVAVSGDQVSSLQAVGFAAAIGGSVAASLELRPERGQIAAGVGWAVLAMLAFGAYYLPMHAASTQDWLWPAFLFRCTSVTLVWSIVLVRRAWPTGLRGHWLAIDRDRLARHGRERALRGRGRVARAPQRRLGARLALPGRDGDARARSCSASACSGRRTSGSSSCSPVSS